jgi:hypothetical protein
MRHRSLRAEGSRRAVQVGGFCAVSPRTSRPLAYLRDERSEFYRLAQFMCPPLLLYLENTAAKWV